MLEVHHCCNLMKLYICPAAVVFSWAITPVKMKCYWNICQFVKVWPNFVFISFDVLFSNVFCFFVGFLFGFFPLFLGGGGGGVFFFVWVFSLLLFLWWKLNVCVHGCSVSWKRLIHLSNTRICVIQNSSSSSSSLFFYGSWLPWFYS